MVEIIPSILTSNPLELVDLVNAAEGKTKRLQIDIDDGSFLANKTIDPVSMSDINTSLLFDFHLMVTNPISWVEKCIRSNANRIIAQVENMPDQAEFIKKVQETSALVGLALNIDTPLEKIDDFLLIDLDVVLLMSVEAGAGGQKFEDLVLPKIKHLTDLRREKSAKFRICIDGGVTDDMLNTLTNLGVDEVIMGRSWFTKNE